MNLDLLLCAVLTALACSLAGVFLVTRRSAMLADAISHSILPGLVAGYAASGGPSLWHGLAGAAAASLVTIAAVNWLTERAGVRRDSAIGLVFPTLFALGMVMVSLWFRGVHLDADSALFGDIAMAPLERVAVMGWDAGPRAAWAGAVLSLMLTAAFLAWRGPLSLSAFDPEGAKLSWTKVRAPLGGMMVLCSVTTALAFSAAGAVMSVALMVLPCAAAGLAASRLGSLAGWSMGIAVGGAAAGVWVSTLADLSVGGCIVAVLFLFLLVMSVLAPRRGLVAKSLAQRRLSRTFEVEMLLCHLASHEGAKDESEESRFDHLIHELGWSAEKAARCVGEATRRGLARSTAGRLSLTENGREIVAEVEERGGTRGSKGHISAQ
jgi:manganese/zinc/iron transport system permease protein